MSEFCFGTEKKKSVFGRARLICVFESAQLGKTCQPRDKKTLESSPWRGSVAPLRLTANGTRRQLRSAANLCLAHGSNLVMQQDTHEEPRESHDTKTREDAKTTGFTPRSRCQDAQNPKGVCTPALFSFSFSVYKTHAKRSFGSSHLCFFISRSSHFQTRLAQHTKR